MSDAPVTDAVQEMYAALPSGTRAAFQGDSSTAQEYYSDFVQFVSTVVPADAGAKASLLDVGCGCGWSSYSFAQNGYNTMGVDLNAAAFEPPWTPNLTLREASVLRLPFAEESFDAVVAYQCLEHIPSPEAGLLEMLRVCKIGGTVCIVGPNCLSPFVPLKSILRTLRHRDVLWGRCPSTPRHPYGNTLWEHLISILVTAARLINKVKSRKATFTMRVPDTVPPFHGDNNACYLCNPTDLVKWFSEHDCEVVQAGRQGRLPLSYLFASGTWIAAKRLEEGRVPAVADTKEDGAQNP